MQLTDVLCYMILTITVTTSCVGAEEPNNDIEDLQLGRKLSRREATVILANYPGDRIFQKPKVIYRRISKHRFGAPKSKYGAPKSKYGPPKSKYGPPKPKYKTPKTTRKPSKRTYKSKPKSPKYGTPEFAHRKRSPKPRTRYGHPKMKPNGRPGLGHIIKMPHYSYLLPDKHGFAEPPMPFLNDYRQKQTYGEPPVDSYTPLAPLKASIKDIHSTPHTYQETSEHFKPYDFEVWDTQKPDPDFAFTKKEASYMEPNNQIDVASTMDYRAEPLIPDRPERNLLPDSHFFYRKKKPIYFADSKVVNKPWTPNKHRDLDEEVIVGGQYAEPPARYVATFSQNAPSYADDDDYVGTFNPLHGFVETDVAVSPNHSPYSNYKNSNMAFSPQNLNDAFSIVDK